MKLDKTDKRILRELQRNARISNLELAERVNLSPTPCARRVKLLEESGVIKSLRGFLANEKKVPREDTYISGYWKIGMVEDEHQRAKRAAQS